MSVLPRRRFPGTRFSLTARHGGIARLHNLGPRHNQEKCKILCAELRTVSFLIMCRLGRVGVGVGAQKVLRP